MSNEKNIILSFFFIVSIAFVGLFSCGQPKNLKEKATESAQEKKNNTEQPSLLEKTKEESPLSDDVEESLKEKEELLLDASEPQETFPEERISSKEAQAKDEASTDPCDPNPCKEDFRHLCRAKAGKAYCFCDKGYKLVSGKCIPEHPCDPNPCQTPHRTKCEVQESKAPYYRCSCDTGYREEAGQCVLAQQRCGSFYAKALNLHDDALKRKLRELIKRNQDNLGYSDARKKVFLVIDNVGGKVQGVYTGRWVTISGNKIPKNNDMNIEHTWPKSKMPHRDVGNARSDLYHLFPTDAYTNSSRASFPFGWVDKELKVFGSKPTYFSRLGYDLKGNKVFEVAKQHRGNVARAMFYFSVRYVAPIDDDQEAVLRKWNKEDPIDAAELKRADKIFKLQKNHNPFIDCPQFADQIKDF